MTEEQLQRINQRKQMRTINAHQLAKILEKQGNSVEFISIPNKKSWWLDSGCHQTLFRTSSTIKAIKNPVIMNGDFLIGCLSLSIASLLKK